MRTGWGPVPNLYWSPPSGGTIAPFDSGVVDGDRHAKMEIVAQANNGMIGPPYPLRRRNYVRPSNENA